MMIAAHVVAVVLGRPPRSLIDTTTSSNGSCCNLFRTTHHCLSLPSYYHHHRVRPVYLSAKIEQSSSSTTSSCCFQYTQDYFISKYNFSPDIASKLSSASARMRKPQNADLLLSFLKEIGFSNAHLDKFVRYHAELLSLCPERSIKPKFKVIAQTAAANQK